MMGLTSRQARQVVLLIDTQASHSFYIQPVSGWCNSDPSADPEKGKLLMAFPLRLS